MRGQREGEMGDRGRDKGQRERWGRGKMRWGREMREALEMLDLWGTLLLVKRSDGRRWES